MKRASSILLFLIIILAAFFRFWHITETPPGLYPDEAMNGNNAVEALRTGDFKIFYPENNGREGLFINIQALSIWMFGNEPWALRIVSALFGTLTVLGIYLLARELFYKNSNFQTLHSQQITNSKFLNPKRFGFLNFSAWNLFGVSDLGFRISRSEMVALLSSFFLASSFWHINFSRIGFRAIMVPFFLVWSFYFLYRLIRALREENAASKKPELFAVLGGILFGLGFHTYIAYRAAPLLLIPPFIFALSRHLEARLPSYLETGRPSKKCSPCLIVLFLFAAFVAALPMGYYFLTHPEDFAGRTAQVSVFASEKPAMTLGLNVVKTIGMFFWAGDYNWRHNLPSQPQLWWPVSILFLIGIAISIRRNFQFLIFNFQFLKLNHWKFIGNWKPARPAGGLEIENYLGWLGQPELFLLIWLAVMSLPAIVTAEGIPHALRTIGMIPPAMILSAMGFVRVMEKTSSWLEKQKIAWPHKNMQLQRIGWELGIFAIVLLVSIPIFTIKQYFFDWAPREETYNAFSGPYTRIGREFASFPPELPTYVIVNADGVLVRGIPMPAQTVMFIAEGGVATRGVPTLRNITYILPENENTLEMLTKPYVAVWLNPK